MKEKGYVHLYTGNGKGKTTAALGLALRAAGSGMQVFIAQFVKGMHYSEITALKRFEKHITLRQYGRDCFIEKEPAEPDFLAAKKGFEEAGKIIMNGSHELVILDEINIALYYKLIELSKLISLIHDRPQHVEIVLTGRYAPQGLIDLADLVTNMDEVKHYYYRGVTARPGIEF